jgi:3-methyl-2-oxobutanoate hydroxymethyltransferase
LAYLTANTKRVTTTDLIRLKAAGKRITMLTAYDTLMAAMLDQAGIDVLLVGDSLGMVIQGHETTLPVTLDEVVYHTRAVVRGTRRAHVVADMPFMSYQASIEDGVRAAGRLMKEGGAHAVKLEGGAQHVELVQRLVSAGIPVMGHIGLTPQSVHQVGGFKVQGKDEAAAQRLIDDARALEAAGCYTLVLEGIPATLARQITDAIGIPTIGIGAGAGCDGQVLVIYDLLGLDPSFKPRFVRRFAQLADVIVEAAKSYAAEVKAGTFPADAESFGSGVSGPSGPLYSSGGQKK